MTPDDRLDQRLTEGLRDLAGTSRPDYRNTILGQVARTRQRPAWTFPERWIPMTLIAHRGATAPPLRRASMLLIVTALTLALAVGLAIAGALLLGPPGPENLVRSVVTIPVPALAETWDATTIEGLANPAGLDIGPDGNLYVANGGTGEILVISPSGALIDRWGAKGAGPGQFDFQFSPADPEQSYAGVAVARDGSVYVADFVNDRIQQLTADGDPIRQWGSFGPGDGQFLEPYDVAIAPAGDVYVVDDRRDDIQRFSADGTHLLTFGRHGEGDGEMDYTSSIAVDGAGAVLNADYGNDRVQAFDAHGSFLWSLRGAAGTNLVKPTDVDVDAEGRIYVTDLGGLKVFGPGRDLLATWSYPRVDSSENYSMAVGADGWMYILSREHSLIWRLALTPTQVEASPAPTLVVTPSTTPMASAAVTAAPSSTPTSVGDVFAVPFSVDLPARWTVDSEVRGEVQLRLARAADEWPAWVDVSVPLDVYTDPCHRELGFIDPPLGATVSDLAEALTSRPGFRAGPIEDVVIDGFPAKAFHLDNTIDMTTCSDQTWLSLWTHDGSANAGGPAVPDPQDVRPATHLRMAVVDVDGTRVVIWTHLFTGVTREEVAEAYGVFDSIDFR